MNSSLLFDQFISKIQEIIDIEWLFKLITMFIFIFMWRMSCKKTAQDTIYIYIYIYIILGALF